MQSINAYNPTPSYKRPARSAKIAAIAKIAKIMKDEMEYEDNDEIVVPFYADKSSAEDLSVTSAHTTPTIPKPVPVAKPKTPSFSELLVSNLYPEFNAKNSIRSGVVPVVTIKSKNYLNECDDANKKYCIMPEFMKYLIANPCIMMFHPKFRDTVEAKMDEFCANIDVNKTISGYEITDKYRAEFKALSTILKSMSKFYTHMSFDETFNNNIEKIAGALSVSADVYTRAMNNN
jgi:hypothetical protein